MLRGAAAAALETKRYFLLAWYQILKLKVVSHTKLNAARRHDMRVIISFILNFITKMRFDTMVLLTRKSTVVISKRLILSELVENDLVVPSVQ